MDWGNPLRSVAPTVDADVLAVLVRTHEPVTGNQLARLAGRSYAQVRAVVGRLVAEGVVVSDIHGRTYTFRLNRDHVLVPGLLAIISAPSTIQAAIAEDLEMWDPSPEFVAVFGSAARRTATRDSDIDLLVVRRDSVDVDNEVWRNQIGDLVRIVEVRTGNRVQLVELAHMELVEGIDTDQPLIRSLRRDGRTLYGGDLSARLSGNRRDET